MTVSATIRLVDRTDDDDLALAYRIAVASDSEGRDDRVWAPQSRRSFDAIARHTDAGEAAEWYLISAGARDVALLRLWIPLLSNTDRIWAMPSVDPAGDWTALAPLLMEQARQTARAWGRDFVVWEITEPVGVQHPFPALLRAAGATTISVANVRCARLPVPPATLDSLEAAATAASGVDYDVRVYPGELPRELWQGYLDLLSLIDVDAPTGDLVVEPDVATLDRLAGWYELDRARDMVRLHAVALHRETGAVVALSDLVVRSDLRRIAGQDGTYVHREHRGHRLGLAVKIANLRYAAQHYPDVTAIRTSNDEANRHMVAINVDLGFEIVERELTFRLAA